MLAKTYFEGIYPHIKSAVYYPSRKNNGIFITLCFFAAGSNYFTYIKGKRYTSGDVSSQRKIYDGTRPMKADVKASFNPFNVDGLTEFFESNIEDGKIKDVMRFFGIPPTSKHKKDCLCKALALQLKAFVDSDTDEADDIAAMEYQRLLSEPMAEQCETQLLQSALYPGDKAYNKTKYRPTYQVNIYEQFQHTWEFENIGMQTWRGRKLYFSNHDTVRPRAEKNCIDIPDTPPHKGVKITVSMDARGFEETTECKWIMVDKDGNDCFPNSGMFTFLVKTRFGYQN